MSEDQQSNHRFDGGFLEVVPERMRLVPMDVDRQDQRRIIRNRVDYLNWMQRHFSPTVLPPEPEQGAPD